MVYRIMVVEDDLALLELYSRVLSKTGAEILKFHDGLAALHHLETQPPPHLMTLDINMPGMTGTELLKEIKFRLHLTDIKVVVLTANMIDLQNEYVQMADVCLEKPVFNIQLFVICQQLLKSISE